MQVADRFGMEWRLFYDNKVKRVAILVSRMDHCLYDLLIRHRAGSPCHSTPGMTSNSMHRCNISNLDEPMCSTHHLALHCTLDN